MDLNLNRFRRSKKGQMAFFIILLGVVLIFVYAVVNMFTYKVFDELNTDIQADASLDAGTKAVVDDLNTRFPETFDNALLMIVIGFFLLSVAVGYFGYEHPALIVLFIVIAAILMLVAMQISNTWDEISNDAELTGMQANFPISDWVLDNYLMVIGSCVFACLIAMFIRQRYGG